MSTLFPNYEEDIFISYSHVDNLDDPGWVDQMHDRLEKRLWQLLGEKPEIWRDPKIGGADLIEETIIEKLKKIGFLISILSPRYIKSKSCLQEVEEFYRRASENGGIRSETRSRILKVLKTPIEDYEYPKEYPPEFRQVKGYTFYEKDAVSKTVREFLPIYGGDSYAKFVRALDDMAWEIKILLVKHQQKLLREQALAQAVGQSVLTAATPPDVTFNTQRAEPSGVTVYLAETSELNAEREEVRRSLQMLGHYVLPDEPLPLEAEAFAAAVSKCVSRSQMSIHLLGANYNSVSELQNRSLERAQYELVAKHQRDPKFCRLIWSPKDLKVLAQSPQADFLQYAQYESSAQPNDEFLQTKLEDLKTIIEGKLKTCVPRKSGVEPGHNAQSVRIYVICDEQDFEAAVQLRDLLFQYDDKIQVVLPMQEGEDFEIAKDHQDNLLECNAAIIFYDRTREPWLRQQFNDLRKINGDGRNTPLLPKDKAIYVVIAENDPKEKLKRSYANATRDAQVAMNFGEISLEPLKTFLAHVLK
ncbi:MAG TPA: toll/interleukin-1 receptor domain-containing protein [Pyrinomonadaceae bacterium]|nr:toll/interleukin-1 receptor domain-containing protein [Pyrinomonadaceae bacterium]